MRRGRGVVEARGRRGGDVMAEKKPPALRALTRGEGAEMTLLTGGVHLSVRGEWWRWAGLFPACGWAGIGLAGPVLAQLGCFSFFFCSFSFSFSVFCFVYCF